MSITKEITRLRGGLAEGVALVAVSKMQPVEAIMEAYGAGQRAFGESRPQEMARKQAELPADIEWHQIGPLQRNKVRLIAPFVQLIHSIDSPRLLETIESEAERIERKINVLLEIKVAREATKQGWDEAELWRYLDGEAWREMRHVGFRGVMGIATNTPDERVVRREFVRLREIFEKLRKDYFGPEFDTLSMGMSGDWPLAVECGSTMLRIGSQIFITP